MNENEPEFQPFEDRIIVKDEEMETVTKSGLVLPDQSREKSQIATVISVGNGRWDGNRYVPLGIYPNDKVIYSKYGGTEIELNGEKLMILTVRDILAIASSQPSKPRVFTL